MRALVVDDEAPARRKLVRFLRETPDIEIVGEAADADAAIAQIRARRPDVVFLDVQMPGADGFCVVEALADDVEMPHIVFVSAHDRYAVRAFDIAAVDYLLKPFDRERLGRTLERIRAACAAPDGNVSAQLRALLVQVRTTPAYLERLLVEIDERRTFVAVSEIIHAEARGNTVAIRTSSGTYMVRTTMDALETRLDPHTFVRVHRSHIVRIDAIAELQPWFHGEYSIKLVDGTTLNWSRRYAAKRVDLLRPT